MHGDILFINQNQIKAVQNIYHEKLENQPLKKYIIAISGEVESGKSEIAHLLGKKLAGENKKAKVLNMDSYYKIPPNQRRQWRREHGPEKIGIEEYDWEKINETIQAFKKDKKVTIPYADVITQQLDELTTDFGGIDVLILNGLYTIALDEADFRVFIELSYEDTLDEQKRSQNETIDEWRLKELEQEHQVLLSLKDKADYFVDLDTSLKFYHL
ncbi:MAG: hypothetical protein K9J27_03670 [Bacteroidales bacterium]|nr:hypothetical protein [Bacteroidales bacterium]MCF8332879.1 hypothetical protein [Bacteroidales bacterium]